jgi:hypothetical protein
MFSTLPKVERDNLVVICKATWFYVGTLCSLYKTGDANPVSIGKDAEKVGKQLDIFLKDLKEVPKGV